MGRVATMSRAASAWPLLQVLALALAYYAAARLGLLLAFDGSNASPLWPPSGIALAAVVLFGRRMLAGVALGAFVANAVVFHANGAADLPTLLAASSAIAAGNALEALLGAWALQRWVGRGSPFDRLADVAKFFVVVPGACAAGALVGTATLLAAGIAPGAAGPTVALTWWTGDVAGMLVLAPLLMMAAEALRRRRPAEALALASLLVVVVVLGAAVFVHPETAAGADRRWVWLFLPAIAWAAFRHGPAGVALTSVAITGLAVLGTTRGLGPFARGNLNDALIVLQTFVVLCTLTGLLLAADRRERVRLGRAGATRRDLAAPWTVLLGSLAVAVLGWHVVASDVERRAEERFEVLHAELLERVIHRVGANIEVLRGAVGLFAASQSVERDEWRRYVAELDLARQHPGIQAVGYAEVVAPPQRAAHEARVRAEGFPAYALRPDGERDTYTAIVYIEPFDERNRRAFGFDMFSEPVRRAAMERARDTGQPSMTSRVRLVQEAVTDVQAGVLIYLPLYRPGRPVESVEQRREALVGYVYSPIRMGNLANAALGTVHETAGLAVRLFTGESADAGELLYASGPSAAGKARVLARSVELAGQAWTFEVEALPAFEAGVDRAKAQIVLIAGVGISLLLFALVRSLTMTRERAELLALDMTAALRDSERKAQQELALRQRADAELEAKNAALQRSNDELAQFAYVASHDLQEPLRTVAGYSQLLLRRHRGTLDGEAREFLDFIGDAAKRAQALVADLLTLARVERRPEAFEVVPLQDVFDDARRSLAAALGEAAAVLTQDPLPAVAGERGQLRQLMQNLLGNALKFRGPDAPRVHVGARSEGDGMWRISIADNGIGIDPRFHDRIFALFQRLHRDDYPGTGIGLAICKKVVERHGGRIGVESAPGRGATFFFTIRAAAAAPQPVRDAEERSTR